jgi:hypothetical protein
MSFAIFDQLPKAGPEGRNMAKLIQQHSLRYPDHGKLPPQAFLKRDFSSFKEIFNRLPITLSELSQSVFGSVDIDYGAVEVSQNDESHNPYSELIRSPELLNLSFEEAKQEIKLGVPSSNPAQPQRLHWRRYHSKVTHNGVDAG